MPKSFLSSFLIHARLFGIRGIYRRAALEFGASEELPIRVDNGKRVCIRLRTTDVATYQQIFVDEQYDFSLAKMPEIIIDAGANIGLTSVYFATRFPTARIFAIEPDHTNFAMLKRNCASFPQINPIHAALWNRDGSVRLFDPGEGKWGMRVGQTGKEVPSITLDTIVGHYGIKQIDILKIDIEGAEYEVLNASASWIGKVNFLCVEPHDRFRDGCSSAFNEATTAFPVRWPKGELWCASRVHVA